LYGDPTVPDGSDGVVTLRVGHGAGFIVKENDLSAVCAPCEQLSVARTVKLKVPEAVGVPEMPPEELKFSPAGREPD
jgi:hypothetical protein